MSDEAGFLAAIRQTPADDVARLVFADWLDEQDEPTSKLKAEFIRLELRMAEAPEKSLNRVRWLNQLQKLAAQIDPTWLAVVSHPKLEACRMSFRFECPKQWSALLPTADVKKRFCGECKKHVHYCDTLQEAQAHAANGNCVALSHALVRKRFDLRPPQPAPPRHLAPRRMGRVLPHMLRGGAVAGRLERPVVAPPPPPPADPDPEPAPAPAEPEPMAELQPRSRRRPSKKTRRPHRTIERENREEME